jgi:hypothetical protein
LNIPPTRGPRIGAEELESPLIIDGESVKQRFILKFNP